MLIILVTAVTTLPLITFAWNGKYVESLIAPLAVPLIVITLEYIFSEPVNSLIALASFTLSKLLALSIPAMIPTAAEVLPITTLPV